MVLLSYSSNIPKAVSSMPFHLTFNKSPLIVSICYSAHLFGSHSVEKELIVHTTTYHVEENDSERNLLFFLDTAK